MHITVENSFFTYISLCSSMNIFDRRIFGEIVGCPVIGLRADAQIEQGENKVRKRNM
jgi:hypothetical protein